MALASPKRRRRPKDVDVSLLPPLETINPADLKKFSKEELTAYLASRGIRAKFSKPEMKRQVRLLIQAIREDQPEIIRKLQEDGLKELVEIPSRKSARRYSMSDADSGDSAFGGKVPCIGEKCKKKANRDCEFQRCRSCCTKGGYLCYTHVSDFTRLRTNSVGSLGRPTAPLSFSGPPIPSTQPIATPYGMEPHPYLEGYHKQLQELHQFERLQAQLHNSPSAVRAPPSQPQVSPKPGVGRSFNSSGYNTPSGPTELLEGGRSKRSLDKQGLPPDRICPGCGFPVSTVGSNFLAHLRDCDEAKYKEALNSGWGRDSFAPQNELPHSSPVTRARRESSMRYDKHLELLDGVFDHTSVEDVMCKLGNTSLTDPHKDLEAAKTVLSGFTGTNTLDDELHFWENDRFSDYYSKLDESTSLSELEAYQPPFESEFGEMYDGSSILPVPPSAVLQSDAGDFLPVLHSI